jgi:predicted transcriptional regulator
VTEILKVATKGASKTRIMYDANLRFKGVNQYINFLMENELLLKTREDFKLFYFAFEKGLAFISGCILLMQLPQ